MPLRFVAQTGCQEIEPCDMKPGRVYRITKWSVDNCIGNLVIAVEGKFVPVGWTSCVSGLPLPDFEGCGQRVVELQSGDQLVYNV